MKTLLQQRHSDIPDRILKTTKKYTRLDEDGRVLECLERKSVDTDFVDTTEIEQERRKIADYEKQLAKMQRKAIELKEKEPDYAQTTSTSN